MVRDSVKQSAHKNMAIEVKKAYPVPTRLEDWHYRNPHRKTIIDYVDEVHRELMVSDAGVDYRKYLDPIFDSESIEGKMARDDQEAARLIREYARDNTDKHAHVATANLQTVMSAMFRVWNLYNMGRRQRANAYEAKRAAATPQSDETESNGGE